MDETNKDQVPVYEDVQDPNVDQEKNLIEEMKRRFSQDKTIIDQLVQQEERNTRLYFARYIDKEKLPELEAEDYMMVPKLFSNLETVIPLVTRKSPEFDVKAYPATKKNQRGAATLRQDLEDKWQMSESKNGWAMQPKQQENLRNLFTQHVVIWKLYWNVDENRMCPKPVELKNIVAPLTKCRTVSELPYIFEKIETDTLDSVIAKFPKKEQELREALTNPKMSGDSTLEYWEYWKNDTLSWWYKGTKDVLLGTDPNPYWNAPQEENELGIPVEVKNHLKRPSKPYIIDTDIRKGNGMIGPVSLVSISDSTVRALDTDKNQIRKNLRMSNGLIVVDETVGTAEEAAKLDFSGRKIVQLKTIEGVAGHVDVMTGRAVDNAILTSMDDNRNIMDENTGANDVLRGERESSETLGGQQIRRQSALTRNEPLFQLHERNAQEMADWYAQFLCVFGDQEQTVYGASVDSSKVEKISKKIFEGDVEYVIIVKDGSTTPIDKKAVRQQAWDEVTAGVRSYVDYYREIEAKDPEGLAKRAILQQNDPMALIAPQGEIDVEAVLHIESIILGREAEIFSNPDPMLLAEHLRTHAMYRDGNDIDEDLDVSFKSLDSMTKIALKAHEQEELMLLKELKMQQQMQQQAEQAGMDLQAQGIDPTAVALAGQQGVPTETPISQSSPDMNQVAQPSEAELAGMNEEMAM